MMSISSEDIQNLREWISANTGMCAEDYRDSFLSRRILPRLSAIGAEDIISYLALLEKDNNERKTFIAKLFVQTTEFFRNQEVFDTLSAVIKESFRKGDRPIGVMSAPCSTGEEAVSIAIVLNELEFQFKIVAVDRSRQALRKLQEAKWSAKKIEKVDKKLRERYFRIVGNRAELCAGFGCSIFPVCADLTKGFPGRGLDLIFLRNLLIYMTEDAQKELLKKAVNALNPGGLLVLGAVEALPPDKLNLKTVNLNARIYRYGGER